MPRLPTLSPASCGKRWQPGEAAHQDNIHHWRGIAGILPPGEVRHSQRDHCGIPDAGEGSVQLDRATKITLTG